MSSTILWLLIGLISTPLSYATHQLLRMLSNYPLKKFGENNLVHFPPILINQVSLRLKDSGESHICFW